MALAANERFAGGFVRNSQGALVLTTVLTGAAYRGGFLRDPDGRLVVTNA